DAALKRLIENEHEGDGAKRIAGEFLAPLHGGEYAMMGAAMDDAQIRRDAFPVEIEPAEENFATLHAVFDQLAIKLANLGPHQGIGPLQGREPDPPLLQEMLELGKP